MSKEAWFRHYERLEAECPELSEDELSEQAYESLRDEMADQADLALDRSREPGGEE